MILTGGTMDIITLAAECRKNGTDLDETALGRLNTYMEMLLEWNEKINLTAITKPEEIVEKHFYDCILPLSENLIHGRTADVGSGAGFPGIVWKIVKPELPLVLIEPTGKRCTFLNAVIRQLELEDIAVVNQRSEDFVKQEREAFDTVSARAVANLRVLSELCLPLVRKGGVFAAMKGSAAIEEADAAKHAMKILGASLEKVQECTLPSGDARINLFYRKTANTPPEYPRNYGRIKKQPL